MLCNLLPHCASRRIFHPRPTKNRHLADIVESGDRTVGEAHCTRFRSAPRFASAGSLAWRKPFWPYPRRGMSVHTVGVRIEAPNPKQAQQAEIT